MRSRDKIGKLSAEIATRHKDANTMYAQIMGTDDPAVARRHVPDLESSLGFMEKALKNIDDLVDDAREASEKVATIRSTTEKTRAEEKRLAEEKAAAEAHAALIVRERERVREVEQQGTGMITSEFNLEGAVELVETLEEELKTEESKKDLSVVRDRFHVILGLKTFLVREINREPMRFGYDSGRGSRQDIQSADAEAISVQSGKVPWKDISLQKLSGIMVHYVSGERVGPSRRADAYMAMAFLCRLNGADAAADKFEAKASFALPNAQERIERLRPGTPEAP